MPRNHPGPALETPDGLRRWPPAREAAWLGLLEVHRRVTRALETHMPSAHGRSYRAYDLLSRLAHCDAGRLRMSALAEQTLLSQSRVSRMIDDLERDGLVERETCCDDSRVVYASITDRGREHLRAAQDTFFRIVERRLFGNLSAREVEQLARIMGKVLAQGEPHPGA